MPETNDPKERAEAVANALVPAQQPAVAPIVIAELPPPPPVIILPRAENPTISSEGRDQRINNSDLAFYI